MEEEAAAAALSAAAAVHSRAGAAATAAAADAAAILGEALTLLEAATLSVRLSRVLIAEHGVAAVVRAVATLTVVRVGPEGYGAPLCDAAADEALARACAILLGLARIVAASPAGIPGLEPPPTSITDGTGVLVDDNALMLTSTTTSTSMNTTPATATASASPVFVSEAAVAAHRRARSGHIVGEPLEESRLAAARSLQRGVVFRVLARVLNARVALRGGAAAAALALGVATHGRIGGVGVAAAAVGAGAVEALVGALRAHPGHRALFHALATALGCLALAGRALDARGAAALPAPNELAGAAAVAARGGSRQLLRELGAGGYALWQTPSGAAAGAAALRALLLVAETRSGAVALRKQGAVDAVIAALDAAGGGAGGGGEAVTVSTADGNCGGKIDAPSGTTNDAPPATELYPIVPALAMAILSKLLDARDLATAIGVIKAAGAALDTGTGGGSAATVVALTTVAALAAGGEGGGGGGCLWFRWRRRVYRRNARHRRRRLPCSMGRSCRRDDRFALRHRSGIERDQRGARGAGGTRCINAPSSGIGYGSRCRRACGPR